MRARVVSIPVLTFLLLSATANFATAEHLVTAAGVESFVDVREAPAATAPKVGELKGSEHAMLLGSTGDWRKVRLDNGVVGYVNADGTQVAEGSDFAHGEEAFDGGDYTNALEIWTPLAEAGDARAQFGLGNLYFNGLGVEVDQLAATEWYLKAALQGYAPAQFNLGNAFKHGRGVPKDETLANQWWEKAADQGLAAAQYDLGLQYYFGVGVKENREIAKRWLARAARQGHPQALTLFDADAAPKNEQRASNGTEAREYQAELVAEGEPESWIARQPPAAFTIQILATRDSQSLRGFINRMEFQDPIAWFRFKKSGENWYGLIQGTYESRKQAQIAATSLESNSTAGTVWIRRFAEIHDAMATR